MYEADISVNEFESVEERLHASIYDCAPASDGDEINSGAPSKEKKEPSKEGECFVYLACRINAANTVMNNAAYDKAYQWLTEGGDKAVAAEAVFSLYPEADRTLLLKLYDEQETLRPALIRIFRKQMHKLPTALVNTATAAENASTELKVEALNYAAANADFGPDLFRAQYVPRP